MSKSLLIGNGLAILAAAVELGSLGQQVILLTDGKPLGGHFAGMRIEGLDFDIGMVLLEEHEATISKADLRGYDPKVRNDWTRFASRVSAWMRSKVDLVKAQTPECLIGGRKIADYLISNRLDGLAGGPIPPIMPWSDPRHAIHKYEPGVFDTITYAEAAKWNHGELWHRRFVQPFIDKIFPAPSAEFLARYHRVAWAPLYYPETLARASCGDSTELAEYPFWTTPTGFVGQLVKVLRHALTQLPTVSLITQPLASLSHKNSIWTVSTADGRGYVSRRLAIGLTPDRACDLLGVSASNQLPAAGLSLLLAAVESKRIRSEHGCTLIVDEAYAGYRLTDQDAVAGLSPQLHRIVLEASSHRIAKMHPGKALETALLDELTSLLGLASHGKEAIRFQRCFTTHNSLYIPTAEHVRNADWTASQVARAAPGALLTGSLLGYGATSLNDQIVQALRISEEFG